MEIVLAGMCKKLYHGIDEMIPVMVGLYIMIFPWMHAGKQHRGNVFFFFAAMLGAFASDENSCVSMFKGGQNISKISPYN